MKLQNINNIIVIILATFLSFSLMGCDSDAKKSYTLTVHYINNTNHGVNATITHSYREKTLQIPGKESKSYIDRYYVREDGFFATFISVVLDFDDGKQVIYSSTGVDAEKETNLCDRSNYTKIKDSEYLTIITEDHYNEAK